MSLVRPDKHAARTQSMVAMKLDANRVLVKLLLDSNASFCCLILAMLANMTLLVVRVDHEAAGMELPVWVTAITCILLTFYTLEMIGRMYVDRTFLFWKAVDLIDVLVLIVDYLVFFVDNPWVQALVILRTLRLLRIARSMLVMVYFPELSHMIRGLTGAVKALFWGSVVIIFILIMWGSLAVRLIHPLNEELTERGYWTQAGCDRCPRAFATVASSILTFTQSIIAGDSWGTLAIPLIEHYPPTIIFFSAVLLSVLLASLNLLLAIVLDKANESRAQTEAELLAVKDKEHRKARDAFTDICKAMDEDESGCLTLTEIETGWDTNLGFRNTLRLMDIEREDLWLVFFMLDDDESGHVAYEEFADQLFKMRSRDVHTMIAFIRFYVFDIWRKQRNGLVGSRRNSTNAGPAIVSASRPSTKEPAAPGGEAGKPGSSAANQDWMTQVSTDLNESGVISEAESSAWSKKVRDEPPQEKLQAPAQSEDLANLNECITKALAGVTEKLEQQTRVLESMRSPTPPEHGLGHHPMVSRHSAGQACYMLPQGVVVQQVEAVRSDVGQTADPLRCCSAPVRHRAVPISLTGPA